MSSRRQLVNRSGRPVQTNEGPKALPLYQAPKRPLTAQAKRDLQALTSNQDARYHKLLEDGIKFLSIAVADTADLLEDQKQKLNQLEKKREAKRRERGTNEEASDLELRMRDNVNRLEAKLEEFIVQGEKAVRELIDWEVESTQRGDIIQTIMTKMATAPPAAARERTHARRTANRDANAGSEDEGTPEEETDEEEAAVTAWKPIELFREEEKERRAMYEAQSLRDRYAESKLYAGFRKTIHMARHGEETPMPPTRNWFKEDGADFSAPQEDDDGDGSDDGFVIQRASTNTKCPLSMMDLTEPYSNNKCVHVYEKSSLIGYIRTNGTAYNSPTGAGPKQVQCVVPGCDEMISEKDCHTDPMIVRKVKKALLEQKRLEEDDSGEDEAEAEDTPRGTQRRPAQIDEDDDEDDRRDRRSNAQRIKAERMSRGVSSGRALSGAAEQTGDFEDDDIDEDTGFAADEYEA